MKTYKYAIQDRRAGYQRQEDEDKKAILTCGACGSRVFYWIDDTLHHDGPCHAVTEINLADLAGTYGGTREKEPTKWEEIKMALGTLKQGVLRILFGRNKPIGIETPESPTQVNGSLEEK